MVASYRKGEITLVEKRYKAPFVLEKEKLTRIVSILEESLKDESEVRPQFTVELRDRRIMEPASLEELLRFDNTIRNPITALGIKCIGKGPHIYLDFDGSSSQNVHLEVISNDPKLANNLFAELEEQIERSLLQSWVYRYLKNRDTLFFIPIGLSLTTFVIVSIVFLLFLLTGNVTANPRILPEEQIDTLLSKAQNAVTIEDKTNFLLEAQRAELLRQRDAYRGQSSMHSISQFANLATLLLLLPCLIAFGCVVYNLLYCYPRNIFAWGDYGEWYTNILARRKTVWSVVVTVLLLGMITNVSVTVLGRFLP